MRVQGPVNSVVEWERQVLRSLVGRREREPERTFPGDPGRDVLGGGRIEHGGGLQLDECSV